MATTKAVIRERFAPSPTGLLHLGHAFSALTAFDAAQAAGGEFLLRIEDIDQPRCRKEYEDALYEDLKWLGISWNEPVMRQSDRMPAYMAALAKLNTLGLTYPCRCSRKDIQAALSAPQEGDAPLTGPGGTVYPGTCRELKSEEPTENTAIRLNMRKAIEHLGGVQSLYFDELGAGKSFLDGDHLNHTCGDIVLARKDIGTSYHLAVVIDDDAQNITQVTRGIDMASATPIHILLQALLGFPTPIYHHHRLIRDENGKRLAKRHDAMALRVYRDEGKSALDIRMQLGLRPETTLFK